MEQARTDRGFRILADGMAHRRRRAMGEQKTLGVDRIADAVVQEIPVEAIDTRVRPVATGATEPALEGNGGVVEESFASGMRLRRSQAGNLSGIEIGGFDGIGKI